MLNLPTGSVKAADYKLFGDKITLSFLLHSTNLVFGKGKGKGLLLTEILLPESGPWFTQLKSEMPIW